MTDRAPVRHLLENHLPAHVFVPIITRETPGLLPKPDPAGILHIAQEWDLANGGENLIMVSGICIIWVFETWLMVFLGRRQHRRYDCWPHRRRSNCAACK